MKKATVFALAFAAFGILATEANAQTTDNTPSTQQPQEQAQQNANKEQIKEEDLPDGVKQALQNDALKGWQVSEVYKVAPEAAAGAEAKATYEVYFTNAEQKKAIARFDETGKPMAAAAGQE